MDNNLAWMYSLLNYSKHKRLPIKKEYFQQIGAKVPLFKGVDTWFERMNKYASRKGIELEHYIISSGLKEIIEGSSIAQYFKRIYASSYLYSADGVAEWPAQAINYTNKTQFIFRIAKGFMEEYDDRVNDSMQDEQLRIPYENIIYIGDSATDIPCMRLVKSKGGYSIGVFSNNKREKVYQLYTDGRINFYASANYSTKSALSKYVKQIIDEIATREIIKKERKILDIPANFFRLAMKIEQMMKVEPKQVSKQDKKMFSTILDKLNKLMKVSEGDIE